MSTTKYLFKFKLKIKSMSVCMAKQVSKSRNKRHTSRILGIPAVWHVYNVPGE
jgi:hypothetical protein